MNVDGLQHGRELPHDIQGNAIGILMRVFDGDAGLQSPDHLEVPVAIARAGGELFSSKAHRYPELGLVEPARRQGKLEVARHHADDLVRLTIQQDFAADDGWIAMEAALPCAVAQHRNLLMLRILLLREDTAEDWLDAERGKYAAGQACAIDLRGLAASGQLIAIAGEGAQRREAAGAANVLSYLGAGDGLHAAEAPAFQGIVERDEPRGILKGKRTQQHAFHQRKDGGGGADAEGER